MSVSGAGDVHKSLEYLAKFKEAYEEKEPGKMLVTELMGMNTAVPLEEELQQHITVITDAVDRGAATGLTKKELDSASKTVSSMVGKLPEYASDISKQLEQAQKVLTQANKVFTAKKGGSPSLLRRIGVYAQSFRDPEGAAIEQLMMKLESSSDAADTKIIRKEITNNAEVRRALNKMIDAGDHNRGSAIWDLRNTLVEQYGMDSTHCNCFLKTAENYMERKRTPADRQAMHCLGQLHEVMGEMDKLDAETINQLYRGLCTSADLREAFNEFLAVSEKRWPLDLHAVTDSKVDIRKPLENLYSSDALETLDDDVKEATGKLVYELNHGVIAERDKSYVDAGKTVALLEATAGPNRQFNPGMGRSIFRELIKSQDLRDGFNEFCSAIPKARAANLDLLEKGECFIAPDLEQNMDVFMKVATLIPTLVNCFPGGQSNDKYVLFNQLMKDINERAYPINTQLHSDAIELGLLDFQVDLKQIDPDDPETFVQEFKERPGVTDMMVRSLRSWYVKPYCNALKKIDAATEAGEAASMPSALYAERNTSNLKQAVGWYDASYTPKGGVEQATRFIGFSTENGQEKRVEVPLNFEPLGDHTAEQSLELVKLAAVIDESLADLSLLADEVHRRLEAGESVRMDDPDLLKLNFPNRKKGLESLDKIKKQINGFDWLDQEKKDLAFGILIDFSWKISNGMAKALLNTN